MRHLCGKQEAARVTCCKLCAAWPGLRGAGTKHMMCSLLPVGQGSALEHGIGAEFCTLQEIFLVL